MRISLDAEGQQTRQGLRSARLWEIDALRGVAVVLMVVFHLTWSLQYYGLTAIDVFTTPWQAFARSIGTLFTFLLGLSLTLDAARRPATAWGYWSPRALRRGALLLGLGMAISLVTYLLFGPTYVRFGILHLLGASIILAQPLLRARSAVNLIAGLAAIATGSALRTVNVTFPWLIWLGLEPEGAQMVDYYPLLPWFGFALLGVAAGQALYSQGRRRFSLPDLGMLAPMRALRFLGRHSLPIYLIHMPLIFGLLFLIVGERG